MTRRKPGANATVALAAALAVAAVMLACSPEGPSGVLPTHPSEGFSVTLGWDAPTQDAAGRPLTDLAGYRLYYSTSLPPSGPDGVRLDLGLETRATVSGIPAGRYYFAVTAIDAVGNESDLSDPLEVEIGQ